MTMELWMTIASQRQQPSAKSSRHQTLLCTLDGTPFTGDGFRSNRQHDR